MPRRNIVVIGASLGGLQTLRAVLSAVTTPFPASVFVVQHLSPSSSNYLPILLDKATDLTVRPAVDGDSIVPGTVSVAPADRHLLVDRERVVLSRGPSENRARPAIDPLFRSAALSHGASVVGVVLSGLLDDGVSGLVEVQRQGGYAIVQDPETAIAPDMPRNALRESEPDEVLTPEEIGRRLNDLVRTEAPDLPGVDTAKLRREVDVIRGGSGYVSTAERLGRLVPASCPDCGGPMWEIDDSVRRFRCHTGHAYTLRHLTDGLQAREEESLWVALRVMEERVRLLERLAEGDDHHPKAASASMFRSKADEAKEHVARLRGLLNSLPSRQAPPDEMPPDEAPPKDSPDDE